MEKNLIAAYACANCHSGLSTLPIPTENFSVLNSEENNYDLNTLFQQFMKTEKSVGEYLHDFHLSEAEAIALAKYISNTENASVIQSTIDKYPNATIENGKLIYRALVCANCHSSDEFSPNLNAAPD